ncbi:MAG TPA: AAA family ATPase [Polyangiaceae bacterium]
MRLAELGLLAFGPFTDCVLDFSAGAPGGLHVIYGRNEAGKSTALRAVSGLLFGIPERTQDVHLHPPDKLRVSGVLEVSGRSLGIIRRKKRKAALRDARDEPLDEAELARWLGGVDRELYRGLFGLDHHVLKLGGEALLAGKGDVGESLYDAGMGGRSVHAVLLELTREAEALFKPRGENPRLNVALKAYRESLVRRNEAVLTPQAYFDQQQQLEARRARKLELAAERQSLQKERDRLLRLAGVLKPAANRRELIERRATLGRVRELVTGTREAREQAQHVLGECAREMARLERSLARQQQHLEQLPVDESLLRIEPEHLQRLGEQLTAVHKVEWDVPLLRAAIAAREDEARAILQKLGRAPSLEDLGSLRPNLADEQRIRELERCHAVLLERVEAAHERQSAAESALSLKRRELAQCRELSLGPGLVQLLQRASRKAHLEENLRRSSAENEHAREDARQKWLALGVSAELEGWLVEAIVPELEAVEQYALEFREHSAALRRAVLEHEQHAAKVRDLTRQVARIQRRGPLPTEEALDAARRQRDTLWQVVERALRGVADPTAAGPGLSTAFESAQRQADELADARLREAARIAEIQALTAQLEEERELTAEAARGVATNEQAGAALEARWLALWSDGQLEARSPREARAWLTKLAAYRARKAEQQALERELELCQSELHGTCTELALAFGLVPAPLSVLLDQARARLDEELELAERRKLLDSSVLELEVRAQQAGAELSRHTEELQTWQRDWRSNTARLGLGDAPSRGLVVAFLDELRELFRKLDEVPEKRQTLQALLAEQAAFRERVAALVREYAPDLAELPSERAAEQLLRAANAAQNTARERERLLAEIAEQRREHEAYADRKLRADQTLQELLSRTGAHSLDELLELEQRAHSAADLDARIAGEEERMRELGEGLTLVALLAECEGADRPQVMRDKEDVEARLQETEEALSNVSVEIKEIEKGLEQLRSDEDAAEAAQESEILASDVRELVQRYARVRLAGVILSREINRYRERHQGPVLSRAAELFPRLTLGRYTGLKVGLDRQIILCVRDDGDEVEVSGLSEGAQYQLYLALRLATIERYLMSHDALPLVLDDVLLHFDDERSRAAFEVLGELAQTTQVLFFTHHARHVELAREALGPARAFVHELSSNPSALASRPGVHV